jgi:hypothetical protein
MACTSSTVLAPSATAAIAVSAMTTHTVSAVPGPSRIATMSATSTPTATPITTSAARQRRWPRAAPSTSNAAAGAKNGWGWSSSRAEMNQAMVAATVASSTKRQPRRSRSPAPRT